MIWSELNPLGMNESAVYFLNLTLSYLQIIISSSLFVQIKIHDAKKAHDRYKSPTYFDLR